MCIAVPEGSTLQYLESVQYLESLEYLESLQYLESPSVDLNELQERKDW